MRALIVSDPHPPSLRKQHEPSVQELMSSVFKSDPVRNQDFDLFICLGDMTTVSSRKDMGSERCRMDIEMLCEMFKGRAEGRPFVVTPGNHDELALKRSGLLQMLGQNIETQVVDFEDDQVSVVSWSATVLAKKRGHPLFVTEDDLTHLQDALKKAAHKNVIVLSHVPLGFRPDEIDGRNPFSFFYRNYNKIWDIFGDSGKNILPVSGHLHRLRPYADQFPYCFTVPSLTQTNAPMDYPVEANLGSEPIGAYTILEVRDGTVHFNIHFLNYDDQINFGYSMAGLGDWNGAMKRNNFLQHMAAQAIAYDLDPTTFL